MGASPKSPINQPIPEAIRLSAPPMNPSAHGFGTESNSDTAQQNYLSENASDVIKAGSKSYMNYRERAEWLKNNKPLSGDTE